MDLYALLEKVCIQYHSNKVAGCDDGLAMRDAYAKVRSELEQVIRQEAITMRMRDFERE